MLWHKLRRTMRTEGPWVLPAATRHHFEGRCVPAVATACSLCMLLAHALFQEAQHSGTGLWTLRGVDVSSSDLRL